MSKIVYEVTVEGGNTEWRLNGERHREDGPATEWYNGGKEWWIHNRRHREDGPAIEFPIGLREWWIDGRPYTEAEHKKKISAMKSVKNTCADKIVEIDGVKYKLVKQ